MLNPISRNRRARGAKIALVLLFSLLVLALFRLQVSGSARWTLRAHENHLRQAIVPAPRGTIYDRAGRVLADNVPGYSITLLPGPRDSIRSILHPLQTHLGLSPEEVERLAAEATRSGREVVIDGHAAFAAVSAIEERIAEFPGVLVEMHPHRRYPAGESAAHLLGYVGEIARAELASGRAADDRYRAGTVIGRAGVEQQYEDVLQGWDGVRYVEVDAHGGIVGEFSSSPAVPPVAGGDLVLNVDLALQRWIDEIFPDSLPGAVVALDPVDGGVLALYSAPSFDPNAFVGGVSPNRWRAWTADADGPLFNRATQGLYPPASTWKLPLAAMALDLGIVTPEERMPEPCTGTFEWGGRGWRCWDLSGHGHNDLHEAIANSCDVYFYQLGLRLGLDRLLGGAEGAGFTGMTGIDLPGESRGVFPTDRGFWLNRFGYEAREGEVLSLAIGQGPNTQTPLRVAQFYAALARGGSAPPPTVARRPPAAPEWDLGLSPEHVGVLVEGLRRVTAPGGTAHESATLEFWEVLGKTGTGQNAASLSGRGSNDAWFAGMAGPFNEDPEIVIVVLVERGGSGAGVAAPLAAKIADFYLRRKHGIPTDVVQTLAEWRRTRGLPAWYRERYPAGS